MIFISLITFYFIYHYQHDIQLILRLTTRILQTILNTINKIILLWLKIIQDGNIQILNNFIQISTSFMKVCFFAKKMVNTQKRRASNKKPINTEENGKNQHLIRWIENLIKLWDPYKMIIALTLKIAIRNGLKPFRIMQENVEILLAKLINKI